MIDTVVFRIHDLELHEPLCKFLNRKSSGTGSTITQKEPDSTQFPESVKRVHQTYLMYHDTGKMIEKAHFNHLKSSHYQIAYRIDYFLNFIEFNVSVPKYFFGTNVLQYNVPPTNKKFNFSDFGSIEYNLETSFKLLKNFFERFFLQEFGTLEVYQDLVQITRFDLCYNQVFTSKQEALEYLSQLKKVKKKYSRDASNYSRSWETSMMYKTDRYSFKVYHKGSEFKKNDRKQLAKIPGNVLDLDYLQGFADRILRYEMTFRNSYMSYLFTRYIFRKDCEVWNFSVDLFNQERKAKEKGTFQAFKKSLNQEEKKHIEYAKSIIHKTKNFYLSVDEEEKEFDLETDHLTFINFPNKKEHFSYSSLFSKSLFRLCYGKFLEILKEFELVMFQDSQTILSRVDTLNSEVLKKRNVIESLGITDTISADEKPKGIRRSKIVFLLELLEKYTFEEIEKGGFFHRNTWLNYKKDLAKLGITDKALLGLSIQADFSLNKYNQEIIYNLSKYPFLALVRY